MISSALIYKPLVNLRIFSHFRSRHIKIRTPIQLNYMSTIAQEKVLTNKYGIIETSSNLSPPEYINTVFHETYSSLCLEHEWLHSNRNIAYIQLLISDYLYSYLEHVNHHANFNELLQDIENYRPNMDTNQVVNTLQVSLIQDI